MLNTPDPEFQAAFALFADRLARPLLRALRNAYDEACAQYGSYDGGNESTFGTNVYNFAIHEIDVAGEEDAFIQVATRAPLFRFTAGGYELCCHKVGHSEADDIRTHFPNGKGATTMVEPAGSAPPNVAPEETVEEKEPRRKPRRGEREGEG